VAETGELVLCVARERIPGGLAWRGIRDISLDPILELAAREGVFLPRAEVEGDPTWKQLIPYLLLRDGERIFLMRRTRAGADQRLHDRYSIGIGGHVNPGDSDALGALRREWREELRADFEPRFDPLGVLNDDSDAVGAVHLGLVFTAQAAGRPVSIRETAKLSGSFASLAEVAAIEAQLETWSALLLEFLAATGEESGQMR
jgi:predicted NUDIX family phosphoesterase